MDLKNLFKDEEYSPSDLERKKKIVERLEKSKNALLDAGMDGYMWELVRDLQGENRKVGGSVSERIQEMDDKGVFSGKAGHLAGKKRSGALLGEFKEALKSATKELGEDIIDSWDISAGEMSRKKFPETWGNYPAYEDYFSDAEQARNEDDIYSEAYNAEHRPWANEYVDKKENTLRDFDKFSKSKEGMTLGILNDLDISNLKERRGQLGQPTPSLLDPEEPGITPEEARRRRAAILMAPPEELMRMEMEQRKSSVGKPNPLELPLDKLK